MAPLFFGKTRALLLKLRLYRNFFHRFKPRLKCRTFLEQIGNLLSQFLSGRDVGRMMHPADHAILRDLIGADAKFRCARRENLA